MSSTDAPLVAAHHLSFAYGAETALLDVDIERTHALDSVAQTVAQCPRRAGVHALCQQFKQILDAPVLETVDLKQPGGSRIGEHTSKFSVAGLGIIQQAHPENAVLRVIDQRPE